MPKRNRGKHNVRRTRRRLTPEQGLQKLKIQQEVLAQMASQFRNIDFRSDSAVEGLFLSSVMSEYSTYMRELETFARQLNAHNAQVRPDQQLQLDEQLGAVYFHFNKCKNQAAMLIEGMQQRLFEQVQYFHRDTSVLDRDWQRSAGTERTQGFSQEEAERYLDDFQYTQNCIDQYNLLYANRGVEAVVFDERLHFEFVVEQIELHVAHKRDGLNPNKAHAKANREGLARLATSIERDGFQMDNGDMFAPQLTSAVLDRMGQDVMRDLSDGSSTNNQRYALQRAEQYQAFHADINAGFEQCGYCQKHNVQPVPIAKGFQDQLASVTEAVSGAEEKAKKHWKDSLSRVFKTVRTSAEHVQWFGQTVRDAQKMHAHKQAHAIRRGSNYSGPSASELGGQNVNVRGGAMKLSTPTYKGGLAQMAGAPVGSAPIGKQSGSGGPQPEMDNDVTSSA